MYWVFTSNCLLVRIQLPPRGVDGELTFRMVFLKDSMPSHNCCELEPSVDKPMVRGPLRGHPPDQDKNDVGHGPLRVEERSYGYCSHRS